MAKINRLRLLLKGIEEPLIIAVHSKESERLESRLGDLELHDASRYFFNFSSLDGKFYSINLKHLQSVNLLWDASEYALDRTRYEGSMFIHLLNRTLPVETDSETPEEVYDFFFYLETDSGLSFNSFTDMDGEYLSFQCEEIVYAVAPEQLYKEGEKIANEDD